MNSNANSDSSRQNIQLLSRDLAALLKSQVDINTLSKCIFEVVRNSEF